MEEDEQKKIREMLKDKGKSQPLEWMYKGEKPELEDYLLGKRVDKHVEKDEEPKDDHGVGAIFDDRIKANIELDMKAKMREDPLFAIKQKEEDVKRKLLQNPVKMKRLQKKIEEEQRKKMKASIASHGHKELSGDDDLLHKYLSILNKKGKDKGEKDRNHSEKGGHKFDSYDNEKHRKHSKSAKHQHSSDSDSSDEDRHKNYTKDLNKYRDEKSHRREEYEHRKYDKKQNGKRKRNTETRYESERQRDCSPEIRTKHKKSKKHKHKHKYDTEQIECERTDSRKRHHRYGSDDSDNDSKDKRQYDREMKYSKNDSQKFKSIRSEGSKSKRHVTSASSTDSDSDSDDSVQIPKKQYGLIVKPGTVENRSHRRSKSPHISKSSRPKDRSRSPRRHRSRSKSPKRSQSYDTKHRRKSPEVMKPSKPRKLTDDEKKKKLERMMENAQWREEQRTKNVKHYDDEDRKEAESLLRHGDKGANFLNPMMSSHADKSSLEDRIKRNKFNIQRTRADLDKDFLKK